MLFFQTTPSVCPAADAGWGEGVVWGLAGALVLSLALNLTLIGLPRTREIAISLTRGLLVRLRTVVRLPRTTPTLPTPAVTTPATTAGEYMVPMPNFWAPRPPLPVRAPRIRPNSGVRTPTITRAAMEAATAAATAATEPPFRTGKDCLLFLKKMNVNFLRIINYYSHLFVKWLDSTISIDIAP